MDDLHFIPRAPIPAQDPLDVILDPRQPNKLPRGTTEGELTTLFDQVRAQYRKVRQSGGVGEDQFIWRIPLFWFAFYTGLQTSGLGRLRWKHVDFDNGIIYIREQKNRKEQTIPLNQKAREVLENVGRLPGMQTFPPPCGMSI